MSVFEQTKQKEILTCLTPRGSVAKKAGTCYNLPKSGMNKYLLLFYQDIIKNYSFSKLRTRISKVPYSLLTIHCTLLTAYRLIYPAAFLCPPPPKFLATSDTSKSPTERKL